MRKCVVHYSKNPAPMSQMGQSETPNMSATRAAFLGSGRRVRATVAPPTTVNRACYLAAELDPIADAGAGDPGFCNGPRPDSRNTTGDLLRDHRRTEVGLRLPTPD